ncbi:hypothetical protein BJ138DRAFT_1131314 [Hygrophoropsis aurantiaca]|uniref:Uncharacterized protein n=1 Tax=Hygrophoropsis aurantiaca TaxID=72124 RepID=A0ACB7ZSA2_9AGAM|nr:hypothetical protein BJ138DRAFT_1131314 [Hygrophoropsis aurantiaca]
MRKQIARLRIGRASNAHASTSSCSTYASAACHTARASTATRSPQAPTSIPTLTTTGQTRGISSSALSLPFGEVSFAGDASTDTSIAASTSIPNTKPARDVLLEHKVAHLEATLARTTPNPSRVWAQYIDLMAYLESLPSPPPLLPPLFSQAASSSLPSSSTQSPSSPHPTLPLHIHQAILRKCVPSPSVLRSQPHSKIHPYESRLRTVVRNIRLAGFTPALADYHVVLAHLAAAASPGPVIAPPKRTAGSPATFLRTSPRNMRRSSAETARTALAVYREATRVMRLVPDARTFELVLRVLVTRAEAGVQRVRDKVVGENIGSTIRTAAGSGSGSRTSKPAAPTSHSTPNTPTAPNPASAEITSACRFVLDEMTAHGVRLTAEIVDLVVRVLKETSVAASASTTRASGAGVGAAKGVMRGVSKTRDGRDDAVGKTREAFAELMKMAYGIDLDYPDQRVDVNMGGGGGLGGADVDEGLGSIVRDLGTHIRSQARTQAETQPPSPSTAPTPTPDSSLTNANANSTASTSTTPTPTTPFPFTTAALNTTIDMLGRLGDVSKLVQAFEVLTQPLPAVAGKHFERSFDEEEDDEWGSGSASTGANINTANGATAINPTVINSTPHATPNTTSYNLLLRHLARAGHTTLTRHYLVQALRLDRAVDRALRSGVGWVAVGRGVDVCTQMQGEVGTGTGRGRRRERRRERRGVVSASEIPTSSTPTPIAPTHFTQISVPHFAHIPAPRFALNRGTFLPVLGLANRGAHVALLRWLGAAVRTAVRRKKNDMLWYGRVVKGVVGGTSERRGNLEGPQGGEPESIDGEQEQVEIEAPTSDSGSSSSSLDSSEPLDGAYTSAPASTSTSSSHSLSATTARPFTPFSPTLHLSLLARDIAELTALQAQVDAALGRHVQRVKERLGRRVWGGKNVYVRVWNEGEQDRGESEGGGGKVADRETGNMTGGRRMVDREAWRAVVRFRESSDTARSGSARSSASVSSGSFRS